MTCKNDMLWTVGNPPSKCGWYLITYQYGNSGDLPDAIRNKERKPEVAVAYWDNEWYMQQGYAKIPSCDVLAWADLPSPYEVVD